MGGAPDSREARSEGKLHDPPIQERQVRRLRPRMAPIHCRHGPEAGHGE